MAALDALLADFNKIANKSLSWSKSKEVDYGIDLEFFNHRIICNW